MKTKQILARVDENGQAVYGSTPTYRTLSRWLSEGVAKATDGCRVEPDGVCPHGCPSWLVELNLI